MPIERRLFTATSAPLTLLVNVHSLQFTVEKQRIEINIQNA